VSLLRWSSCTGIKHARFEIHGEYLVGSWPDRPWRMAGIAATGSIEIRLSGLRITGKQFSIGYMLGILPNSAPRRHARGDTRRCRAPVVGHRHRWHAFIRAPDE